MATEIQAKDVILLIVYLVILLFGAYYLTKFVSKRAMQKGAKKRNSRMAGDKARWKQGQYVSVVDRIPIDRDKTIMVVEFENKHYLMATTGQDIKLLDKVDVSKETAEEPDPAEEKESPVFGQSEAPLFEDESFFKRFLSSFKAVSKNYFKHKNTAPFGIHLQKEIDKKNDQDIHPDKAGDGRL